MNKDDTVNILADPVRELVCPECGYTIDVTGEQILTPLSCPKCEADLTVPARLGDFILVEVLGSGGMATVYKAYDESLGRFVAVKIMRRRYGDDPKFVERFLREARAAARLNHPNVVQIYSCAQKKGQPYIVMEYVDGGKLDKTIANDSPLAEARVLEIGRDVADGLRAASDIGLVHGDIKPANIVFDRNGLAKVADFGLAHFATEQEDKSEVWGTPYYIAPERARKEKQDMRSDIYCLGATLFHAITGQPPFEGETAVDVVMARLKEPPPDIQDTRPDLHPMTARLIGRMLEVEKIKRYPNYHSLLSDFEKAGQEMENQHSERKKGKGKKSEGRSAKQVTSSVSKKSQRKRIVAVIIFLIAIGVGIAGWMLWSPKKSSPSARKPPPPTAIQEEDAKDVIVYQPFTDRQDQILADILEKWTPETLLATERDLEPFAKRIEDDPLAVAWKDIFLALIDEMRRDEEAAEKDLNSVLSGGVKEEESKDGESDGDESTGRQLPVSLAEFFLNEEGLSTAVENEEWPKWYADFIVFIKGFDSLLEGDLDSSLQDLDSYSAIESPEKPRWPYSLQNLAENLAERIRKWQKLKEEVDSNVEQEDFKAALDLLGRVRSNLFVPFKNDKLDIVKEKQQAFQEEQRRKREAERKKREQEEAARRKAEREKHEAAVKRDMELLESTNKKIRNMLMRNQFSQSLSTFKKTRPDMETEEGSAEFKQRSGSLEYLRKLKAFLISSINSNPYRGATDILKGGAIASSPESITVELSGGAGTAEYSWERVRPRLLIPMTRHYLQRSNIIDRKRAEITMGLAEYSELRNLNMEDKFRKAARKFDPQIAGEQE